MSALTAVHETRQTLDSEGVAIVAQNRLIEQLVQAGVDVAVPARRHGFDLIAYLVPRERSENFGACPIRMKAAHGKAFGIDNTFESIANLLNVFVWGVGTETTSIFALTNRELSAVADQLGYSLSPAFQKGLYPQQQSAKNLTEALEPFRMNVDSWRTKIASCI
jgi:hypothetical protein